MAEEAILARLDAMSSRQEEIRDAISDRLDETNGYLKALNGKVADHERWILQRSGIDKRIELLEQTTQDHQRYIDQRQQDLRDFVIMKDVQARHQQWIDQFSGARSATVTLCMQILTLLGVGVSIYAALHGSVK